MTFATRASAEGAKQDLQVITNVLKNIIYLLLTGKRGHCFLVGTNRPTHAHTLGRVGGGKQSDAYIN